MGDCSNECVHHADRSSYRLALPYHLAPTIGDPLVDRKKTILEAKRKLVP